VTIRPIELLLRRTDARRIRRESSCRQSRLPFGTAALLGAALALVAGRASAGWVGDAMDLMGTRVSVELWDDDEAHGRKLVQAVMEDYKRVDREMSTYKPDSEISFVNDHAAEKPIPISEELFNLIDVSLQFSVASHGAFDITYESVGYMYDFHKHEHPNEEQIKEHLSAVDYRHVVLERGARTIAFTMQGVRINLGGIAKGWLVQHEAEFLKANGVEHALLNAGGDTRVIGDRRGKPWIVGIRHPRAKDQVITRLPLVDEAISTAGDYERFFEEDGKRYHHVINPKTGEPTEGILTVTAIGPSGTITDGLDTAIFVLGVKEGLELIKKYPGYETIIVDSNGKIYYSEGLEPGRE
jgi:FAD:protein FMN transferase